MKKEDIKISVLIPMYNAEKYIERCLKSILSQSFPIYEIIIVDDGSTDNSLSIVSDYQQKYDFIKVFTQKNARAAAARNRALRESTGTHIAFIDADDFISKHYFEILVDNMIQYDTSVSICGFYETSADKYDDSFMGENEITIRVKDEILYDCCANNKTVVVSPCCKLYLRDLFEGIAYPEGRTYEDLATTHIVLYKAEKIVISKMKLYCYFKTPESVVHGKYTILNFDSENIAQDERLMFYGKTNNKDLILKNIIAVQRNRITNYCRAALYLDGEADIKQLRIKFIDLYKTTKQNNHIPLLDNLLFMGFILFPWSYVHILYRGYVVYNERKRKNLFG